MEICISGVWGTVCDDSWDDNDARVVCRRLGLVDDCKKCFHKLIASFYSCFIVATAHHYARFGQGEGPIHLDGLRCTGEEESLLDCCHRGVGNHSCGHYEDGGVLCYNGELKN